MERINPLVIELSVEMVRAYYGIKYASTAEDLAKLISDEFDCICLPEDVEKYVLEDLEIQEQIEQQLKLEFYE